MRAIRYTVAALVLGAVGLNGCQPRTTGNNASAAADSAHVADSLRTLARLEVGQRAFLAHCAMCHGNEGNGDGEVATVMQSKNVTVARLNDQRSGP